MTQCSDSSVEFEIVGQQIFDFACFNRLQVLIVGTFGNDDNRFPLTE
jgi:hypothetical protein